MRKRREEDASVSLNARDVVEVSKRRRWIRIQIGDPFQHLANTQFIICHNVAEDVKINLRYF